MNELQQVLLIFAVVVIAGLYFLSRSRQAEAKKQETSTPNQVPPSTHSTNEVEPHIDTEAMLQQRKASEALNDLGSAHIPVSENTEKRFTQESVSAEPTTPSTAETAEKDVTASQKDELKPLAESQNKPLAETTDFDEDSVHPNQGKLFFGEEFDVSKNVEEPLSTESINHSEDEAKAKDTELAQLPENDKNYSAKHHVLVVDDPGMTGELSEEHFAPEHDKPSFGIPEVAQSEQENANASPSPYAAKKDPEVFVIMVMTAAEEFEMVKVNQALYGVGLTMSDQSIFVKKDNMGNAFIKVANLLEPGTFPTADLESYSTPGVAMILELPTSVRAPAAMHELIMMGRKVSQRLNARLYNMERQLIKESDLQSMRDAALDYESEPLAQ